MYELIMDTESQALPSNMPKKTAFVRAWKVPLPVRRSHVVSDILMIAFCLTLAAYVPMLPSFASTADKRWHRCIGQIYYIQELHEGTLRIPNDDFDRLFDMSVTRDSPVIWDDVHQTFLHDANPVPVHSHNDYTHRIPLFEALASGCISVEADVHLVEDDLLVGHSSKGLHKKNNLRTMYLEPLQRMLEAQNRNLSAHDDTWQGIFKRDTQQTVVLLVDQKTFGQETFTELHSQLQPLRELGYLTHWNGTEKLTRPLTIVATGKTSFDSITALDETHRDIFFDAHLEALPSTLDDFTTDPPRFRYNQSNSHYASTQFKNAVVFRPMDRDKYPQQLLSTPRGKDLAATQTEQAAARGLLTRYWDAPKSPPNLHDSVWRWLVDANVGVINMDDIGVVRDRTHGWGRVRGSVV
jgi:hypothetical protein